MNTDCDLTWPELSEQLLACSIQAIHSLESLDDEQISQESPLTTDFTLLNQSKKIQKTFTRRYASSANDLTKLNTKCSRDFWHVEEDEKVIELYNIHGPKWATIAAIMKTRSRKQIRDRYLNSLRPDINYSEWTPEEEELFSALLKKHGKKWCKIAAELPGRTENQVKNKFYCPSKKTVSQKMSNTLSQGQTKSLENLSPSGKTPSSDCFFSLSTDVEFTSYNTIFRDSFNDINYL